MKSKISTGARLLLGLIYFVFGLNGFLNFIPTQPQFPETAMGYLGALASSGYFIPVVSATQTISGLLLLSGFAAPVALVILSTNTEINVGVDYRGGGDDEADPACAPESTTD